MKKDLVIVILIYCLSFFIPCNGVHWLCETGWILKRHLCFEFYSNTIIGKNGASQGCGPNANIILPRSAAETTAIQEVLQSTSFSVWLDIEYDTSTRQWVDRDKNVVTYQRWADPNDAANPQGNHCAGISKNGKWSVEACTDRLRFVCFKQATFVDYCSPNECENGECREVKNQNFPNDNFTCVCPEGFKGRTCKLIDDPCVYDPKAKCKNGGTCKVKEHPGKNDWFCICRGELKRGQAKDCSEGKSERQKLEESRQKMVKYVVGIPSGVILIVWVVCCICECAEAGELSDVDMASESSTTSFSGDTDVETAETSDQNGRAGGRNKTDISSNGKSEASTKNSTGKTRSHSDDKSLNGRIPLALAKMSNLRQNITSAVSRTTLKQLVSTVKNENEDDRVQNGPNGQAGIKKEMSTSTKSENNTTVHERDEEIQNDQDFKHRYKRHVLLHEKLDQTYLRSLADKTEKSVNDNGTSVDPKISPYMEIIGGQQSESYTS